MNYITKISIYALILVTVFFTGCTAGANAKTTPKRITPKQGNTYNTYNSTVSISVDGGREKDPLGTYEVSNSTLLEAVKNSINSSKLFTKIVEHHPNYKLELFIVKVGQPIDGHAITVYVEITWVLLNGQDGELLWKKSIITAGTKTPENEFDTVLRIARATESAIQKNISEGIKLISKLDIN